MSPAKRSPKKAAILAVDGGGSKVDAALLDRDGRVLGAGRVNADGYEVTGDTAFLDQIHRAVAVASDDAGIEVDHAPVANLGVYCLSGADLPTDDRRIARGLAARRWSVRDVLRNDTFAVIRAGTERTWGVGVVCGSGTNCTGISPDGRLFRLAAVGSVSGDFGGGSDLGEQALWHAIRSEDGRGEKTVLQRDVPEYFGYRSPRKLMEAMYLERIDDDRVRELAPVLFRAAGGGDAIARSIVTRQADEIVAMARAAIRRLRMTRLDPDVVLGGGVFRNDDAEFFERIRSGLRAVCPAATIHVLTAPPVIGAAMLGLDVIRATRSAHARARRSLTHARLTAHTSSAGRSH